MEIKRIVMTGPESTGKTTLAKELAGYFGTVWVPEYARTYLEQLGRPYRYEDLEEIAKGQIALEKQAEEKANSYLFYDTGMLVLKIWAEYKYGKCPNLILDHLYQQPYDLFLLCGTDVPWEYDPLREHPSEREVLFAIYQKQLQELNIPFFLIKGNQQDRLKKAIQLVSRK
jgi:NadR type nicotinamide-nucleotide adenylyltransferase